VGGVGEEEHDGRYIKKHLVKAKYQNFIKFENLI
jgi:hypothetical protein